MGRISHKVVIAKADCHRRALAIVSPIPKVGAPLGPMPSLAKRGDFNGSEDGDARGPR